MTAVSTPSRHHDAPTEPEPPTPGSPLAAPCRRCGRDDGCIPPGHIHPAWSLGYCMACYMSLYRLVERGEFGTMHQANAAVPYTGNCGQPTGHDIAHARAQGRTWSRLCRLRDHAARHLPATIPALPLPPDRDTTPALLMRHSKAWRDGEAIDLARDWHTLRPTPPDGWRFAATDDAARAA
jgi:hypothetical protein